MIFSIIEQILAIVTCCVPSLRVLVRRWVDNDSSTSGKGPGSGSKSYGFDGSRGSSRKAFIFGGRSRGSDSESSEMGSRTAPGGIVREDKVSWTEHKVCPVHGEP